jgi:hypothetical protein
MAEAVQNGWKVFARKKLGKTRTEYIRAIQIERVSPDRSLVVLTGVLPNLVEQGMGPQGIGSYGPYNVGDFLLKTTTKSIRRNKQGQLYLHVPFRHGVAGIRDIGGEAAVSAARALQVTKTRAAKGGNPGHLSWGGRMPANPALNQRPSPTWGSMKKSDTVGQMNPRHSMTMGGTVHFLRRAHATDPLAGMVRLAKKYATATQGHYMTFRTISEGGKPWISQGVKPRRIADTVISRSGDILRPVMRLNFRPSV